MRPSPEFNWIKSNLPPHMRNIYPESEIYVHLPPVKGFCSIVAIFINSIQLNSYTITHVLSARNDKCKNFFALQLAVFIFRLAVFLGHLAPNIVITT